MELRFEYITQEGCRIEEPWQKSQLAAIATPPPTYQLCKDAEALCLLVGTFGLLCRRQARPHEELAAARVEELHALRDFSVRPLSEADEHRQDGEQEDVPPALQGEERPEGRARDGCSFEHHPPLVCGSVSESLGVMYHIVP